ncbi:MAG: hypothetical protein ACYTFO_01000 [Planctomycetota bacterium]
MSDAAEQSPFKQALAAAKANLLPAVFLWAAAVALILLYSFVPPVKDALDELARFKDRWGYAFSAISTPIFAVVLPLAIQRAARALGSKLIEPEPLIHVPLLAAFWAYRGAEIDLLYRLQDLAWGAGQAGWQLGVKVLIDQGVYVLCWAVPTMVVMLLFKECGYSIGRTRRELGKRWYRARCVPILVVNWVVWLPAVAVLYSLPQGLRIPVMNINVCLFVLLVMFATGRGREPVAAP